MTGVSTRVRLASECRCEPTSFSCAVQVWQDSSAFVEKVTTTRMFVLLGLLQRAAAGLPNRHVTLVLRPRLLIVGEMGHLPLSGDQASRFFHIVPKHL